MDSNRFALGPAIVPAIDDILRDGARRALQAAIEREVEEYIERNKGCIDDQVFFVSASGNWMWCAAAREPVLSRAELNRIGDREVTEEQALQVSPWQT